MDGRENTDRWKKKGQSERKIDRWERHSAQRTKHDYLS